MSASEPVTMKEVQLRLGAPQHVLIHLCEKGVIKPDFAQTSGRGKRREFSQRNLFEFALALALRRLELPVASAALIVRLLRAFADAMRKAVPGFELPASLLDEHIDLRLHIVDGGYLVFDARGAALKKALLLGASLEGVAKGPRARPRIDKLDRLPVGYEAKLEIDLTRIAKRTR